MTQFKIGDKVKVVKTCESRGCGRDICIFLNKIGEIRAIDSYLVVDKFGGMDEWCSGFKNEDLELVKKEIKRFGIVDFLESINIRKD